MREFVFDKDLFRHFEQSLNAGGAVVPPGSSEWTDDTMTTLASVLVSRLLGRTQKKEEIKRGNSVPTEVIEHINRQTLADTHAIIDLFIKLHLLDVFGDYDKHCEPVVRGSVSVVDADPQIVYTDGKK